MSSAATLPYPAALCFPPKHCPDSAAHTVLICKAQLSLHRSVLDTPTENTPWARERERPGQRQPPGAVPASPCSLRCSPAPRLVQRPSWKWTVSAQGRAARVLAKSGTSCSNPRAQPTCQWRPAPFPARCLQGTPSCSSRLRLPISQRPRSWSSGPLRVRLAGFSIRVAHRLTGRRIACSPCGLLACLPPFRLPGFSSEAAGQPNRFRSAVARGLAWVRTACLGGAPAARLPMRAHLAPRRPAVQPHD